MKNLEDLEYDDGPERPSKSQKKRDMHALQEMGAELVELSAERLARIDMPDDLREALREAQRLTKHEARRRQMQYIGRLMRDVDPAPLREALDVVKGASAIASGCWKTRRCSPRSARCTPAPILRVCASCAAMRSKIGKRAARRAPSANCSA
jgi:hypothetical protein